jgi:hypothetical protein
MYGQHLISAKVPQATAIARFAQASAFAHHGIDMNAMWENEASPRLEYGHCS